ncbi:hypothetical protein MUK72_00195 [Halococcus dombrowskii]|uniref:Uncharacterized protein n=1 Tax=Halococcus dombrowskii TaxID=179637 RepID=A0AAV3SEW7_HALDO|nr:hypothetical protein [Halococcus dombrowskii]UOO95161.1 hypothetical protein MUK72_00195 [Halococcus dombrowskii]
MRRFVVAVEKPDKSEQRVCRAAASALIIGGPPYDCPTADLLSLNAATIVKRR